MHGDAAYRRRETRGTKVSERYKNSEKSPPYPLSTIYVNAAICPPMPYTPNKAA
jgi:hypothetical protein